MTRIDALEAERAQAKVRMERAWRNDEAEAMEFARLEIELLDKEITEELAAKRAA